MLKESGLICNKRDNAGTLSTMEKLKSAAEKLGIFLTPSQLEQFEIYFRELVTWNTRINLTRIVDYEEVQLKHFLDSLTVSTAIKNIKKDLKMVDVGTGAGLPGIPLKIVFSDIDLTLLEATLKKGKFLEQIAVKLRLQDVEIIIERAESIAHDTTCREKFDIAVSRALAPLPVLAELMLPFCIIGGCCVVQKKGDINKEVEASEKAITVMGGRLREIKPIELKELNDNRCLVVIDKIQATPLNYPRRPGMPGKRPIIS